MQADARLELQGIFDRALVEEAALAVEEMEQSGGTAPVIDCGGISDVLMDGVLLLQKREALRQCRWERTPPLLRRYAELLGLDVDFGTPAPVDPAAGKTVVTCNACGGSLRVPNTAGGKFACPHCAARFFVDVTDADFPN